MGPGEDVTAAAPLTVADLLEARRHDERPGLRYGADTWTWRGVVAESERRAALARATLRSGPPHIGVLLDNGPEYVFWLGAAALAGAAVVGMNPTRRGAELARDIRFTDCRLLVTDEAGAALLDGLDPAYRAPTPCGSTTSTTAPASGRDRSRRCRSRRSRPRGARRPAPVAVHVGDDGRPQGGALHPGTAGR